MKTRIIHEVPLAYPFEQDKIKDQTENFYIYEFKAFIRTVYVSIHLCAA